MTTIRFHPRPLSLPERIACGVLVIVVLVLGFFFLAAALVAGTVLAGAVLIRIWWLKRRLEKEERDAIITTDYTVIERERLDSPRSSAGPESRSPPDR